MRRIPSTPPLLGLLLALLVVPLAASGTLAADLPLRVVTTLSPYAAIAKAVGGDRVEVDYITRPDEDAHFVKPKPSFALMLRRADLFVSTGLDLELWAPVLVDKSGNRSIREGEPGYVAASHSVPLLDVPSSIDRSAGDVHIYGNPHIFTSPLNAKIVAANIAVGLERIDPAAGDIYRRNLEAFRRRIDEALFGRRLVELIGAETLESLARQGKLVPFLGEQEYEGRKLLPLLGGWLARGLPFRGQKMVAYHKNWIYFTDLFGLEVVNFVEPKPGIPPSARHVHDLIEQIRADNVRVLLAATYFSAQQIGSIAERTGCAGVIVPLGPSQVGADGYFELVDMWIDRLREGFGL